MRILDDTWVITPLDGDDPWADRRSSDWMVGDGPPDESDTTQLELVPVESRELACGRPDPIVASLFTHQRVAGFPRR